MKNTQDKNTQSKIEYHLTNSLDIIKAREGIENLCEQIGFDRNSVLKILSSTSDIQREFMMVLDRVESTAERVKRETGSGIYITNSGNFRDSPDSEASDNIYHSQMKT